MISDRHIAVYGEVQLERAYCSKCKTMALIVDNRLQCCGELVQEVQGTNNVQYMSEGVKKRKVIKGFVKKGILDLQDNKCFYCGKKFGTPYKKIGKSKVEFTKPVFDHVSPFCFSRSTVHNIVAACNLCNAYKSARMFTDLIDIMLWCRKQLVKKVKFV